MVRIRDKLADVASSAYQLAGRFNSPELVLDFLHRLCRRLDPVKAPPDCINPDMLRDISWRIGVPVKNLIMDGI